MRDPSQFKHRVAVFTTILALAATAPAAMPLSELRTYDVDDDGFIEKGPESRALRAAFARLNGQQQQTFGQFLEGESEKLDLSALDFTDLYGELAASCRIGKSFYLARSLAGVSLVHPDIVSMSDKGASFSLSHDNVSGETEWSASGVAVIAPFANRCLHASSPDQLDGGELTGYAFAPFISFNGQGSSSGDAPSDLRVGAILDLQFFGGAFNLQQVQVSSFFRTDFEGKAEIYGAGLRWTPYHYTSRLNGLRGDSGHNGVDYSLSADIEYLSVVRGGNSGLATGREYGWIGLRTGIGYTPPKMNGTRFGLDVDAAYDVINDRDAALWTAGVTIPLGTESKASLNLGYTYGTTRSNPETVDGVSANFLVRF